jgi:hypothetical protein
LGWGQSDVASIITADQNNGNCKLPYKSIFIDLPNQELRTPKLVLNEEK